MSDETPTPTSPASGPRMRGCARRNGITEREVFIQKLYGLLKDRAAPPTTKEPT